MKAGFRAQSGDDFSHRWKLGMRSGSHNKVRRTVQYGILDLNEMRLNSIWGATGSPLQSAKA